MQLRARVGVSSLICAAALTLCSPVLSQVPTQPQSGQSAQVENGKALGTVQDLSRAFQNVGKDVEPSVVNIKVRKVVEPPPGARGGGGGRNSPFNDPFFRRFFDRDGDGEPDVPGFGEGPFGGGEQIGQGSGVIVETDGKVAYIVTNNHVAGDADEMTVVLNDGRQIENGTLVGADAKTDLAVVKIEADNLKPARWGNSDELTKGDWVLAFGAPFGFVGSMTHGIVSATNRTDIRIIPQGYESFIQIDAPINPGNSGGPLVNIHGEVIGINTAIASRSGGFQGIGFAIPSNQARSIYEILKDKGKVVRGWLGVKIASVGDPEVGPIVRDAGYTGKNGVFVHETYEGTPAYGKLQPLDVVVRLNGKELNDSNQLRNQIAMIAPGTDVKLDVWREGKMETVTVKLGDQPADLAAIPGQEEEEGAGKREAKSPDQEDSPRLGVLLDDVSPELLRQYGARRDIRGAVITRVMPGSPAAKANLSAGEIITRVGNENVTDADSAIAAIRKADLKKGVRLYVYGPGGSRFVFVQATNNAPAKRQE